MNNEVIKAIRKAEKQYPIKNWWRKKKDKIIITIFFPLLAMIEGKKKITKWLIDREKWSEKRADKILKYYIPRKAEWDKEEETFYLSDNDIEYSDFIKKRLKLKDRRFWKKYSGWNGEMITYLLEKFQLEGFKKTIEKDPYYNQTYIIFKKIEK